MKVDKCNVSLGARLCCGGSYLVTCRQDREGGGGGDSELTSGLSCSSHNTSLPWPRSLFFVLVRILVSPLCLLIINVSRWIIHETRQRFNWRRNVFTERVNTDLGELTDCDCLHQQSEQKQSSAGEGQLNLSTCLGISKRRKHTHVRRHHSVV